MSRDDSDEIHRRLNDELEGILNEYWGGWITDRRKGQDVALLTPRVKEKSKKPTSSFTVHLSGSDRGKWFRFSAGVGGYPLSLLYYGQHGTVPNGKSDYAEAYRLAREFLGIEARQEQPEEAAEREKRKAAQKEQREREAAQRALEKEERDKKRTWSASEAWRETLSLRESHGEAYLIERGLPPVSEWPWNPDHTIRFHPALDFERDRRVGLLPAVVGRVQSQYGGGSGIWQIYLHKDKPQKADLHPSPKIGRGPAGGGAVRIGGIGPWIGVGEGIETALAAWFLIDCRRPVWACLSTSGLVGFEPPMEIERVTIFPDGDRGVIAAGRVTDPPGMKAARELKAKLDAMGIRCEISKMCVLGDSLDLLQVKRKHEQKTGISRSFGQSPRREDHHREGALG